MKAMKCAATDLQRCALVFSNVAVTATSDQWGCEEQKRFLFYGIGSLQLRFSVDFFCLNTEIQERFYSNWIMLIYDYQIFIEFIFEEMAKLLFFAVLIVLIILLLRIRSYV